MLLAGEGWGGGGLSLFRVAKGQPQVKQFVGLRGGQSQYSARTRPCLNRPLPKPGPVLEVFQAEGCPLLPQAFKE